jgi:hypothetical protein
MRNAFSSKWSSWSLKSSDQPSDKSDKSPSGTNGTDSNGCFLNLETETIGMVLEFLLQRLPGLIITEAMSEAILRRNDVMPENFKLKLVHSLMTTEKADRDFIMAEYEQIESMQLTTPEGIGRWGDASVQFASKYLNLTNDFHLEVADVCS